MNISAPFFFFFSGLAVACSLLVVLKKNPIASAMSLIAVFFSFAGIYALLDAHLIAAIQILVYAGAIMVLFMFVIMLLNAHFPSFDLARGKPILNIGVGVLCLALFALFVWAFKNSQFPTGKGPFTPEAVEAAGGNTRVISELMFSGYILPFELTSVLLLASIVGVVAIAMRKPKDSATVKGASRGH